jgi:uncharacterized protein (TIGR02391 family)
MNCWHLEPEDLAPLLLEYLSRAPGQEMNRYNFTIRGGPLGVCPPDRFQQIAQAATEAWMVLPREGLLAPQPGSSNPELIQITRRGRAVLEQGNDFRAYLRGNLLPTRSLHPVLVLKVRPLFVRGDYETAVFAAFKEVEVAVRDAGEFPNELIGVHLMRGAFEAESGPLRDPSLPSAERQATAQFFAAAIGLFKNPSSHRRVVVSPEDAADLIRLADYLIRWVRDLAELARMPDL